MSPAAKPSLRQRKKDRTRASLIEVSQKLFRKQGYEATTLEQIADGADVSVQTLFVYFESKERLALAPLYDRLERVRAMIDDPERDEPTLDVWRRAVVEGAEEAMENPRETVRTSKLTDSSPTLGRGILALLREYEEILARGLARDHGTDPATDLTTRLLATMLSFGNQTVFGHWLAEGGKGDLVERAAAVVDFGATRFPKPGRSFEAAVSAPRARR